MITHVGTSQTRKFTSHLAQDNISVSRVTFIMASSSTDSRDAIKALASRKKEISSQLKRLAASQAMAAKRRRLSGFTFVEQTFAVRLYVLAATDAKVPILFLKEKQVSRTAGKYAILSDEALKLLLEEWFDLLAEDELAAIRNPVLPQQKKLHDRAMTFLHEHRLRLWVLEQNILKGLAPTTSTMNIRFDAITSGGAEYEMDDRATRGDVSLSRNRMWSLRFRSRWDIHLGKVQSRDRMDTADLTEKVVIPYEGIPHFPRPFFLSHPSHGHVFERCFHFSALSHSFNKTDLPGHQIITHDVC